MTTTSYFTLSTSDASVTKRFKVIQSGYRKTITKVESVARTLSGQQDVSRGALYTMFEFMVKVRAEVEDSDYGTISDLETFFALNNPNATPSDKITLVDHYGDSFTCIFSKDFTSEPLGVMIEGLDAYFIVKCVFEVLN